MRVPPAVLTLTTMAVLWVNSHSPERKNQQLWLDKLKQRGLEFIETGTLRHVSLIPCWHWLGWVNSYCGQCPKARFWFPGHTCSLPGHFRLLTRHSLISEMSGQGLPKGEGYRSTCRVRVSWPRLNPQVLPDREQGLHSPHPPTSQCTTLRGTTTTTPTKNFLQSCAIFAASEGLSAQTDLEACTPWACHWARSPLGRHGGTCHSAGTGPVGTACTYHRSHRTHSLPGTLQRQPRWAGSVLSEAKANPEKHWDSYWERIPFVLRCGRAPPGRSPGICPGEGRILLGIVCRSS